jgi:hypothetical protein
MTESELFSCPKSGLRSVFQLLIAPPLAQPSCAKRRSADGGMRPRRPKTRGWCRNKSKESGLRLPTRKHSATTLPAVLPKTKGRPEYATLLKTGGTPFYQIYPRQKEGDAPQFSSRLGTTRSFAILN